MSHFKKNIGNKSFPILRLVIYIVITIALGIITKTRIRQMPWNQEQVKARETSKHTFLLRGKCASLQEVLKTSQCISTFEILRCIVTLDQGLPKLGFLLTIGKVSMKTIKLWSRMLKNMFWRCYDASNI